MDYAAGRNMLFVILSTSTLGDADLGAVRRRAQWARAALRRGDRVLFVAAAESEAPFTHSNLKLYSLRALGFSERALRRAWNGLDPENLSEWQTAFARALDEFDNGAPQTRLAILADPFIPFAAVLPLLQQRGYRTVYDCLDDFGALAALGYTFENTEAETFLARECELTTVVSTILQVTLRARVPDANIRLLPQGYDPVAFPRPAASPPPPPADLHRGTRTLGFWGHVNDFNVDASLLTHAAASHPDWSIVLLGPIDADPARAPIAPVLRTQPNIHLLGAKPHDALAAYLSWFDATLVPYPAHAFNAARGPLKVYEYLTGYKPIIAAHTPQLDDVPYVYQADSPQTFLAQIEHALTVTVDPAKIDAFLAAATWDARLQQLETALQTTPPRTAPPRVPECAQWYARTFAKNVSNYLAVTEQLLQERTDYVRALENDARAKQTHIERLQRLNPIWSLKTLIDS